MKLILASNNRHKLEEFRRLTADMGIELLSQSEAGFELDVEETGTSFEENAYLKAKAVTDVSGCAAFSDDSGLVVDALGGEPGIYSARYGLGHAADDTDRNRYLLDKLGDEKSRSARFVCCICCTFPNGDVLQCRGECEGEILYAPRGENGFGYDPIFKPLGKNCGMAELSPEDKNAISHRGKATREFIELLKAYRLSLPENKTTEKTRPGKASAR